MMRAETDRKIARLQRRRNWIIREVRVCRAAANRLSRRAEQIARRIEQLSYDCSCVRLNKDIGIADCAEQEAANRRGLTPGFGPETLSADRACPLCHGAGMLPEHPTEPGGGP